MRVLSLYICIAVDIPADRALRGRHVHASASLPVQGSIIDGSRSVDDACECVGVSSV